MKFKITVLVGLIAVNANGCAPSKQATKNPSDSGLKDRLIVVDAKGAIDVEGGVIYVAARTDGTISDVLVREGEDVQQGVALARIENKPQQLAANTAALAVRFAESQEVLSNIEVHAAEREYKRIASLAAKGVETTQRLDRASDAVENAKAGLLRRQATTAAARAELERAEFEIEKTIVRAPLDGKILRKFANPGQRTSSMYVSALFELEPKTPRIVRADFNENVIKDIAVKQKCKVASEAEPGRSYDTNIKRIGSVVGGKRYWSDNGTDAIDGRFIEVVLAAENIPLLLRQRVLVNCAAT